MLKFSTCVAGANNIHPLSWEGTNGKDPKNTTLIWGIQINELKIFGSIVMVSMKHQET